MTFPCRPVCVLAIFVALPFGSGLGCRTGPDAKANRAPQLAVTDPDVDAATPQLYSGDASYVWRRPARVVTLAGLGELFLGDASGSGGCKLVWARDGLDRLAFYEASVCPIEARGDDVACVSRVELARDVSHEHDGAAALDGRPKRIVIDGCAGENELLWHKLAPGREPVTIAPRTFHRRCAVITPPKTGCELTYLRLDALQVASNPEPLVGASLSYDEGWEVCWLESEPGLATVRITTSDTCAPERKARLLQRTRAEGPR